MVDSIKNKLDKTMLLIRFVVKKAPCTLVDFIVFDLKLRPQTPVTEVKISVNKSKYRKGCRYESISISC